MSMIFLWAGLPILTTAISLICSNASACSMAGGYKVPTNLELAAKAQTIVIAEVDRANAGSDTWTGVVVALPKFLLKGSRLPPSVEIKGATLDEAFGRPATISAPRELRHPNPDALIGGCVRYFFSKGMKLVLFLVPDETGVLRPYRSSFSRDSEDVTGDGALWVKTVREYAAISVAPKKEWKNLLRQRIVALRLAGDADSIAIAADMAVEVRGKRLPPFD